MLVLTTAITIALVIERITFACVSLVFYLFGQGPDRKSVWFVSGIVQNISNTTSAFSNAVMRLFSFSVRSLMWCVLALALWGVLYVGMRYSAEGLVALQRGYNSDVGGAIRLAIATPLQLIQLLWDGIVPLYNLIVYCIKTIPSRVLFENVLRNMGDFKQSIIHLAYFMEKLVHSLFAYVKIIISPPDSFDPNLRLLDLITPLAEWRLAVSYMLAFIGDMCAVATSLLDVLMYPFLDINFGLGVHNLVNSLLTLFIHVPAVTIDRCSAGGGPVVYCLPDFEPVIELAVHGIRNFGLLVDNWLDVTMIIIQSVLTATSPACSGWTVVDFNKGGELMGANETVIVGIASNLFAKTDGWNVEVYTRTTSTSLPGAFPLAMNVNYGIASVSASVDASGLLGCICTDQDYGMQLICAVAPLDSLTPSYFVPVEFRVPTTSFYMGCSRSKIKLDSIRWPATRYTLLSVLHGLVDQGVHGLHDPALCVRMAELGGYDEPRLRITHMGPEIRRYGGCDCQAHPKLGCKKHLDGRRGPTQQFTLRLRAQHLLSHDSQHNQRIRIVSLGRHHRSTIRIRRGPGHHGGQHRGRHMGHRHTTGVGESGVCFAV